MITLSQTTTEEPQSSKGHQEQTGNVKLKYPENDFSTTIQSSPSPSKFLGSLL